MNVFQIAQEDIERSSTLDDEDLGKWCFIVRGCFFGFFPTREEAERLASQVRNH